MKAQTIGMIAIHQEGSTVTIHRLKMCGLLLGLALVKRKAIAEEINADLENDCMVCYEPAMQIHSRCLSDPRKSVDHNFDNALR